MANNNFQQLAENILKEVGGESNISNMTHCMTRLRLNLKDQSLVDDEKIKSIKGVIGVNHSGEQYQIIIGQTVDKVFAVLSTITGLSQVKEKDEQGPKEKLTVKSAFNKTLDYLSGSMTPMIPAMITAAMFKTLQVILGPGLFNIISEQSDFFVLTNALYNAFFYFLPIFIGFTAAKKLGASQMLGLYIGAILVVPDLVALAEKTMMIYGFIPTTIHAYAQTVLPAILSVWVMSYVERFFKKIVPAILSTIFVPFLTMLVMTPLILAILAPIGNVLGAWIGESLIAFGNVGGFFAVAVVAALWVFLVMTGMHMVLITFALTAIMTNGIDNFVMVAAILATWACFGLALGAAIKVKDKEEKGLILGYFISGIVGGVTEPTIYGLILKYKRTMMTLALGAFLAGAYAGLTNVGIYILSSSNFLSVVGYFAGGANNIINGLITTAIAFFGTAILTYFFGFTKEDLAIKTDTSSAAVSVKNISEALLSPLSGKVISLKDVPDQVFASEAMGKGIAIEPSSGEVVAPADAEVTLVFPTGHAIGLTTVNGVELLIHVGMDTVSLNGNGFMTFVEVGQRVKAGQPLLNFDTEVIRQAGLSVITPIIVTNSNDYSTIDQTMEETVQAGDFILNVVKG